LFANHSLIELLSVSWVVPEMAQEFPQFDLVEELEAAEAAAQAAVGAGAQPAAGAGAQPTISAGA